MSVGQVLQTTWAALLTVSVAGHFDDERDRQEMADLAESIQNVGAEAEIEFDAHDTSLALEALLVTFRALQDGSGEFADHPAEDTIAGMLTAERLGVAYLTFADQVDRQAAADFELTEAALASITLGLHVLKSAPVMTDELHARIGELNEVRDRLEDLLHTGSPLELPEALAFTLRQNVIGSLSLLGAFPDVLDQLEIFPDLLAALTAERLNALLGHLTAKRQRSVGQA